MTWIKLDDRAIDHPKIAKLSYRAFWWWIKGLSYASAYLTDGVLPPTFFRQAPQTVRTELTDAGLWEFHDPNLCIHDYLGHQQSREKVEGKRKYARDYKKVSANFSVGEQKPTTPDSREQIQSTENRVQKEQQQRAAPLIKSPAYVAKRLEFCAFVGSRIEVPRGLHAELRDAIGGPNPEKELQDWYLELDERAELEAWRIPKDKDFYAWFKALYGQKFPAPVVIPKRDDSALMARLEAVARGEKAR